MSVNKIIVFLFISFCCLQASEAHLYEKQVCYCLQTNADHCDPKLLKVWDRKQTNTQGLLGFLTKNPLEMKRFMRCLGKSINRFPSLQNGFSLSFENGRGDAGDGQKTGRL